MSRRMDFLPCKAKACRNIANISIAFNAVRAENTPADCVNVFVQSFLKAGEHIIPMLTAVHKALLTEYEKCNKAGRSAYQTGGYTNFAFYTRLREQGVNIKVIQDVMGHKNITVTLDIYAEATREKKTESFAELDGAIKL